MYFGSGRECLFGRQHGNTEVAGNLADTSVVEESVCLDGSKEIPK